MFAVIKTGGKQYRVAADDVIVVETLAGAKGDAISFGEVLMLADGENVTLGAPGVSGAVVSGEIVEHRKGDKVKIFKKTRRSTYRRKNGHRQGESVIRITGISADGKTVAAKKTAAKKPKAKPAAEAAGDQA
jgi:large subunit ribosomal protein L21